MIGKLGTVMLVVRDLDRSTAFYRDILGLKVKSQSPGWTQLDAGHIVLGLHLETDRLKVEPREAVQFGFEVADVQQAAIALKSKGVKFLMEPHQESFGWLAIFKDPDGHHIQLYKYV